MIYCKSLPLLWRRFEVARRGLQVLHVGLLGDKDAVTESQQRAHQRGESPFAGWPYRQAGINLILTCSWSIFRTAQVGSLVLVLATNPDFCDTLQPGKARWVAFVAYFRLTGEGAHAVQRKFAKVKGTPFTDVARTVVLSCTPFPVMP